MAKILDTIYGPTTGATGATVDTGALSTLGADGVQVALTVAGGASGAVNFDHYDAAGTKASQASATGLASGSYLYTFFPGGSGTAPSVSAFPGPSTGFKAIPNVAGTVTVTVFRITSKSAST